MPYNRKPFFVEKDHPGIDNSLRKDNPSAICFRVDKLRRVFPVFYVPGYSRADMRAKLRAAGQGFMQRRRAALAAQTAALAAVA